MSTDEDSDCFTQSRSSEKNALKLSKKRRQHVFQDVVNVVNASCSPVFKPQVANGGSIGAISQLRMRMETLSLQTPTTSTATSSRCSSLTQSECLASPASSNTTISSGKQSTENLADSGYKSRSNSSTPASDDETASQGSPSYEIKLENDFVSRSEQPYNEAFRGTFEDASSSCRKMTAEDFEPLRCLGKGAYGTVLLVKQRSTGRLFAQKQLKKASLFVSNKLIEQTKTERQILESINSHPFVVKLYYAFQDHEKLYLILEYGQGGELFTHLKTEKLFTEQTAAFYMAEMIIALTHLHDELGVVYRDLKPENCLLDAEGHLLLTDFGLSKVAVDSDGCDSILGTIEYMAPEVILGKKYGKAVDWWSLGALGYDLMTGSPPFRGPNKARIEHNIVHQKLSLPYFLSPDAKDLLTRLLRKDPTKRLGYNMPRDLETIKKHRFFRRIDWDKLSRRELTPPIQPVITDPELAENFDPEFTEMPLSPVVSRRGDFEDATHYGSPADAHTANDPFRGFSFVAPSTLLETFKS